MAAYVGFGGLGRLLIDGLASNDYAQIFGGAVLVAALAISLDLLSAGVERIVVSPGVRGRRTRRSHRPQSSSPTAPTASSSR